MTSPAEEREKERVGGGKSESERSVVRNDSQSQTDGFARPRILTMELSLQ